MKRYERFAGRLPSGRGRVPLFHRGHAVVGRTRAGRLSRTSPARSAHPAGYPHRCRSCCVVETRGTDVRGRCGYRIGNHRTTRAAVRGFGVGGREVTPLGWVARGQLREPLRKPRRMVRSDGDSGGNSRSNSPRHHSRSAIPHPVWAVHSGWNVVVDVVGLTNALKSV